MGDKHFKSLFIFIALGLFLISLISFIASGGFVLPNDSGGWLYEYQTLIAGLFALFGAGGTVYYLRKQLHQEAEEKAQMRRRKGFIRRSRLPDALSKLTNYSKNCFQFVFDESLPLPDPPYESVEVLRKNLEFLEEKDAYAMFEIISFFQVHNARLESFRESVTNKKIEHMTYDITLFNSYVLYLFNFSRGETSVIGKIFPSETMLVSSFRSLYGDDFYQKGGELEGLLNFIEESRKSEEKYLEKFNFDYQKINSDRIKKRMPENITL